MLMLKVLLQNSLPLHLAFASARLLALRWLVALSALAFEEELCSRRICVYMYLYQSDGLRYNIATSHSECCNTSTPDILWC